MFLSLQQLGIFECITFSDEEGWILLSSGTTLMDIFSGLTCVISKVRVFEDKNDEYEWQSTDVIDISPFEGSFGLGPFWRSVHLEATWDLFKCMNIRTGIQL